MLAEPRRAVIGAACHQCRCVKCVHLRPGADPQRHMRALAYLQRPCLCRRAAMVPDPEEGVAVLAVAQRGAAVAAYFGGDSHHQAHTQPRQGRIAEDP